MQRTVHAPLQFYEKVARVMNSDQERPYVCNAPGCSQRFPTEDHLMIHRHKHEMTLKFPSIKNDNMLSDQTPTPTRFLKNCEEVGLFSELDCSIEQEFCKAQEEEDSKQSISLHGQGGQHQQSHSRMGNHDTSIVIQQALPSPQSSSVITQAPSTNRQIGGAVSSLPRGHHTCRLLHKQLTHRDMPHSSGERRDHNAGKCGKGGSEVDRGEEERDQRWMQERKRGDRR
ncbi:hypothetical protein PBY51_017821 [Eleginops maclovinus]|uniref:C2H2-type domain-containing protein n=1 Tax=Eleginops maclovinus TaxID=56733 RepID=A0AAN8APE2_ELEMC|nr:hypothetical protein PBY51_017821 [Eleginops maclovinus]